MTKKKDSAEHAEIEPGRGDERGIAIPDGMEEITRNKKAGLKGPASHYVARARLSFYLQFKIASLLLIM